MKKKKERVTREDRGRWAISMCFVYEILEKANKVRGNVNNAA